MTTETKRQREKETVSRMIALYCRKNHGGKTLCPNCAALDAYAQSRSDRCPFMETKTFCSNCRTPCCRPDTQEKIRKVPGFSAPARSSATPSWPSAMLSTPARRKSDWRNPLKKAFYIVLGCIGLALGAPGAVLPILPTFPFLMLAAFCFARSSERLDRWFKGTRLYQDNLKDFAAGKGMTRKTKVRILTTVSLLMGIGFVVMGRKGIVVGCAVLAVIWALHLVYFIFAVKTIPADKEP